MLADTIRGLGEVYAAQEDGGSPTTLAGGSAPGESGVSVLSVRFHGGMHFSATPQRHCVCFQIAAMRIERRMAGRALRREAPAGSLAICPAGIDCAADAEESVDALVVAIDPSWFSLAAAEDLALEAQLIGCLFGYDQALLDLARTLALESADDYPNGPLFWNEVAERLHRQFGCSSHLRGSKARRAACWARTCSSGSEITSLPTSTSPSRSLRSQNSGAQPVPLLARVHPIRRHDAAPLRRASPIATRDRTCSGRTMPAWLKSPRAPALLTRATCRVGFGAFTASRSRSWSPDPNQNSRNLHDQSLPSP